MPLYSNDRFISCIIPDGCKHVTHVKFHRCLYLENEALENLSYLKDSLQVLQIISCGNITDKGVKSLQILRLVFVCETILTSHFSLYTHSSQYKLTVVMKYLISEPYPEFNFVSEEQVNRKGNQTLHVILLDRQKLLCASISMNGGHIQYIF